MAPQHRLPAAQLPAVRQPHPVQAPATVPLHRPPAVQSTVVQPHLVQAPAIVSPHYGTTAAVSSPRSRPAPYVPFL
jgi:hypothetical protein